MKSEWVAGWNEPGYLPLSDPQAFASWSEAFAYLREHFLAHAWECDSEGVEASLSSLAWAEGYCEDEDFEYYTRATRLNYFIHHLSDLH